MKLNNLHLIEGYGINAIYNSINMDLSIINSSTFQCLKDLQSGLSYNELAINKNFSQEQKDNLRSFVDELMQEPSVCEEKSRIKKKNVSRITLHISNDCNLRCKYCYAEGGSYKQKRVLMSQQTAHDFVNFCSNNFERIGYVVFFGGEPTLNIPIMEYICHLFKQKHENKECAFLPKFGMITNGTILNEKLVRLIKEYFSFITVSIDGLQEANDVNRIFSSGKGSYEKIHKFIHTIKEETNVRIRYEATYTQSHIDMNYTRDDIRKDLMNEFNIGGDVVDELSIQDNKREAYWSNFDYSTWQRKEILDFPEGFWGVLQAIKQKRTKTMCGIVKETFAISTNGDIYPCHINNGEKNSFLGNINGSNIFNESEYKANIPAINLKENDICINCWARRICGGCARMWFYDFNKKKYRATPNKELCIANKKHLEKILLLIALCRKDSIIWNRLLNKNNSINQ